jgi:hypothetical protein
MSAAMKRQPRGQAVVETALGILVFVTILLFGIHFAEVTVTQMKVTEAASAAMWESTAGQMHNLPRNTLAAAFTVNRARTLVRARYADFDGAMGGTGYPQQILSRARPGSLALDCQLGGANLSQPGGGPRLTRYEDAAFNDNGGLRCDAEAWIDVGGVMAIGTFLDTANGFFSKAGGARHDDSLPAGGYHVCALGRPNGLNGPCTGTMAMLLDDYGLAGGGTESGNCPVSPYGARCASNQNYWDAAEAMYRVDSATTQSGADYNLVNWVVGNPGPLNWPGRPNVPGNPTSFYMAFCGEDRGPGCMGSFNGATPFAGDGSDTVWQTTPFTMHPEYRTAYNSRNIVPAEGACYLGQRCNQSSLFEP